MLRITREAATRGLVDFGRIGEMLARAEGRITHVAADRVTPLAAPLLLEQGRVAIRGLSAEDRLLEGEDELMAEVLAEPPGPDAADGVPNRAGTG